LYPWWFIISLSFNFGYFIISGNDLRRRPTSFFGFYFLMIFSSKVIYLGVLTTSVTEKRLYSHVQKSTYNLIFRPKMAIFRRAGMRERGLPMLFNI
jgi:hypothetical protein